MKIEPQKQKKSTSKKKTIESESIVEMGAQIDWILQMGDNAHNVTDKERALSL